MTFKLSRIVTVIVNCSMIIYVDILLILNIYVNIILLKTTGKITHSKLTAGRCIVSSIYGSLYSLLILLPDMNGVLSFMLKIFAAVTIVAFAFGWYNKPRLLINIFCFLLSNVIFGGVIYGVYSWFKPSFMHFNNTYFYVDFSLVILIVVTTVLYAVLSVTRYFLDKYSSETAAYQIYIKYNGKLTALNGLADTGNSLVDFFSGKPVIICSHDSLRTFATLGNNLAETEMLPKGFRFIPYSTIGNTGLLPVFCPDEVLIVNQNTKFRKRVDVLIGIQGDEPNAIFNPRLLKF